MLKLPLTTTDVCIDECLFANKSINSISSSYKEIESLQKSLKPLFILVLQSLSELFEESTQ